MEGTRLPGCWRVSGVATVGDMVRQGSRRREFSGRLAADPPRSARARARVLCVRPQRRRHCRFRRCCRQRTRSPGWTHGGCAAGPTRCRIAQRHASARQPGRNRGDAATCDGPADRVPPRRDQARATRTGTSCLTIAAIRRCRSGRHVLDLHGEDRATYGPSDALCTSLAGAEPSAGLREGSGASWTAATCRRICWRNLVRRSRICAARRRRPDCDAYSMHCSDGRTR